MHPLSWFKVTQQLEQDNKLTLPASCPSDRTKPCKSVTFNYVDESKVCHDYQEIKIQEEMHGLGVGSVPRSIVAVLQDDLVDYCKAGGETTGHSSELFLSLAFERASFSRTG